MTLPRDSVDVEPEPVVYVLSLLPRGHVDRDVWSVKVEYRGRDLWAVTRLGQTYRASGKAEYEPIPSSRTAAYLRRSRFPFEQAVEIARHVLPGICANGLVVDPETRTLVRKP